MADEMTNNCYLVNAPAGSGKTTRIKRMIDELLMKHNNARILCVTFTNRAADELSQLVNDKRLVVNTIHSFLNRYMKPFFKEEKVIDLFMKVYSTEISDKMTSMDIHKVESRQRYLEKHGTLDIETIRKNIKHIEYNERLFSSLFYGQIGHDDLLFFSKKVCEKFPTILKKLRLMYRVVFIDEYQDTSSSVLKIFHESIKNSQSELYLFGDKMQQIYDNYDGDFETELSGFNKSIQLDKNFRSSSSLIGLLNNIYHDPSYIQKIGTVNKYIEIQPKFYICDDVENVIASIERDSEEHLKLYLLNQKRFDQVEAGSLYRTVSQMPQYDFSSQYDASKVLTTYGNDNPDLLFRFLFFINETLGFWEQLQYGEIIKSIGSNNFLNKQIFKIHKHDDKVVYKERLQDLLTHFQNDNLSIREFIDKLRNLDLVDNEIYMITTSFDYDGVTQIRMKEFHNLCKYLHSQKVSTQHGVKGESHNSVIFVCEDNSRLNVRMFDFLKMYQSVYPSFASFQDFFFSYSSRIRKIEEDYSFRFGDVTATMLRPIEIDVTKALRTVYLHFSANKYFEVLYKVNYDRYFSSHRYVDLKALRTSVVKGVLTAYKLFYVGCSRARERLVVIAKKQPEFITPQYIATLSRLGFEVSVL